MAGERRPDEAGTIVDWIKAEWERGDTALSLERRNYWLNSAFFEGEQWVNYHDTQRQVVPFPRSQHDDRARLVVNRIQPNLQTLEAKLSKRPLRFEVVPSASDDSVISGARLGEHVLEAWRTDAGIEDVRHENLHNTFLGGTAAIVLEWDPDAGGTLGIDHETGRSVGNGDIRLTPVSIVEFTLEPGSRSVRDATYFIMARAVPPAQVAERYDLDELPEADVAMAAGPLQRRLWQTRGFPANIDMATVYTLYQRPTKKNPKGRMAVVTGDQVLEDKPWPFPWRDRLNLGVFREKVLPSRWSGHTMVTDARPLQVALNHAASNVTEHLKFAANHRLALPEDSGVEDEDLTDQPGEIIRFNPMSSHAPRYLEAPDLPRSALEAGTRYATQLDDVMYVHAISRGEAPGDRNSGLALSVLAEKDETPLGLMAHDQADGWSWLGSMALELWAVKVQEFREARVVTGPGVPITQQWTGRQLRGQTKASVPLDATQPHSRASVQQWVMDMLERAPHLLPQDPGALARLMDLPAVDMFGQAVDSAAAQAQRENALMLTGIVPALGDDPYPMLWDDHAKHIAEHNALRETKAYMYAPPEVRELIDLHIKAHEQLNLEQMLSQRQLNAALPGAGAMPQAAMPPGTVTPPPLQQAQAEGLAPPGPAPHALPPGT